ncbi:MAG: YcgL domain-containing protein [Pseudomonadota bacterium]
MNCHIYRCSRKEEMYLYLHEEQQLQSLPEELLLLVGQLTHVMDLELSADRKLARVNVEEVIKALKETGYFIQMPPSDLIPNLHFGD